MESKYRAGGFGYGHAKKALFEALWGYFEPFRQNRKALEADPKHVESVLQDGAARARAEARKTLNAVRRAVGLD